MASNDTRFWVETCMWLRIKLKDGRENQKRSFRGLLPFFVEDILQEIGLTTKLSETIIVLYIVWCAVYAPHSSYELKEYYLQES